MTKRREDNLSLAPGTTPAGLMPPPAIKRAYSMDAKKVLPRVSAVNLPMPWTASDAKIRRHDTVKATQNINQVIKTWATGSAWDANRTDDDMIAPYLNRSVREMSFSSTIRLMTYRSFLRRFKGAHLRGWRRLTAFLLFGFAGLLNLTAYEAACQFPNDADTNWGRLIYLIEVALILLCTALFYLPPLYNRLLVLSAFLALIVTFASLIGIPGMGSGLFAPTTEDTKHVFLGQDCASAHYEYYILHWFLTGYIVWAFLVLLSSFAWMYIVMPIGNWYYLRSRLFIRKWKIRQIKVARVLVPVSPSPDDATRDGAKITEHTRQRFKLAKGIHLEMSGAMMPNRIGRLLLKFFALWSGEPDVKNEAPEAKKVRRDSQAAKQAFQISYTGEVDLQGRPHGFGYWRGDVLTGETLVGFWKEGVPCGPSKSRVVSNGSGFMCIRIGYCKASVGNKSELHYGISIVECSVSGLFYRGFPQVKILEAPALWANMKSGLLKKTKQKFQNMLHTTKNRWNRSMSGNWTDEAIFSNDDRLLNHQTPNPAAVFISHHRSNPAHRSTSILERSNRASQPECSMDIVHSDPALPIDRNNESTFMPPKDIIYRHSMDWVMQQLQPHTPAFGLHVNSEVVISVDRERGLDILGFVPVSQIYLEKREGNVPPSEEEEAVDGSARDPSSVPTISHSMEVIHKPPELLSPRGRQRLAPVAEIIDTAPTPRRQAREASDLHISVQKQSAIEIFSIGGSAHPLDEELQRETEELKVNVQAPELTVHGWVSMGSIGISEVLVYVHGYNNTHVEATQTLGQMATFGNFPPHVKVVVFTWPAGSGLFSFYQARTNSEDKRLHECFRQFLQSLQDSGVRQFHVLCHSMGARVFLKSLRMICRDTDIIARFKSTAPSAKGPLENHQDLWAGKLHLLTATFMNPEYHLDEFIRHDYYILRSICSHITIYSDANDQALFWSETFSHQDALGRSVFGLQKTVCNPRVQLLETDDNTNGPEGTLTPIADLSESTDMGDEIFNGAPRLRFMHTVSFFQMDFSGEGLPVLEAPPTQLATRRHLRPWHRRDTLLSTPTGEVEWLDLDIIDTTYMDTNVHGLRHSFWSLNREIIEDLREILVTRKRASQRTGRLDRRDGNVWVFRVAPSFLTSIFDT